jgi:hypothetical protein
MWKLLEYHLLSKTAAGLIITSAATCTTSDAYLAQQPFNAPDLVLERSQLPILLYTCRALDAKHVACRTAAWCGSCLQKQHAGWTAADAAGAPYRLQTEACSAADPAAFPS